MKKTSLLIVFCLITFLITGQTNVTFTDSAVAHSDGIGLNVSIRSYPNWDFSALLSNLVPRSTFEHNLSNTDVWQRNNCIWTQETTSAFQGKQSAKISSNGSVSNPAYVRCKLGWSKYFRSEYSYELSFAMKKGNNYNSEVSVKLGSMLNSSNFELTDNWEIYSFEFTGNNSSSQHIDFYFYGQGIVYLDDVQLHIKPNTRGDIYNTRMLDLLTALKPANIRWGALTANVYNLSAPNGNKRLVSIGENTTSNLTIGDFVNLSNMLNCYGNITVGTASYTDYFNEPQTFNHLVEYLGGDAGSDYGKIRENEGYTDLLAPSKGLILEFGNEVWGGDSHNAPFDGGGNYGEWILDAIQQIKASPAYKDDKLIFTVSGRHANQLFGWNQDVLDVAANACEWLGVSGYMGGNFDYDPAIPFESELDYYKSGFAYIQYMLNGIKNVRSSMLSNYGKALPFFMYEGNMTVASPEYAGKFGQAIAYIDYCAALLESGSLAIPTIFNTNQGRWKIIENDHFEYQPLALYEAAKLFNNHCKGSILNTEIDGETMTGDFQRTQEFTKVAAYTFTKGENYSVMLLNRDFENTRNVIINLPEGDFSANAICYSFTADNWNVSSAENVTLSEEVVENFSGKTLTLSPHSFSILQFTGDDLQLETTTGYYPHIAVDSIQAYTSTGIDSITTNSGSLEIEADFYPENCTAPYFYVDLIEEESTAELSRFVDIGYIKANGQESGNGIVKLAVIPKENPELTDTLTIHITNQGTSSVFDKDSDKIFVISPNPACSYFNLKINAWDKTSVSVKNLQGQEVFSKQLSGRTQLKITTENWVKGIYIVSLKNKNNSYHKKLIIR